MDIDPDDAEVPADLPEGGPSALDEAMHMFAQKANNPKPDPGPDPADLCASSEGESPDAQEADTEPDDAEERIDELFDEPAVEADPDEDENAKWQQRQEQAGGSGPLEERYLDYIEHVQDEKAQQARSRYKIFAMAAIAASAIMGYGVYDSFHHDSTSAPKPTCAQQVETAKDHYANKVRAATDKDQKLPVYKAPACARPK